MRLGNVKLTSFMSTYRVCIEKLLHEPLTEIQQLQVEHNARCQIVQLLVGVHFHCEIFLFAVGS